MKQKTSDSQSRKNRSGNANTGSKSQNGQGSQNAGQKNQQQKQNGGGGLEKFFLDQLKDIYYAEQKITQSLPKMKEASTTDELKEAFDDHLHQTQKHIKRLEKVFEMVGQRAEGKKCEAIEGIAREAEQIISETEQGTMTRDAALIMAAQKVEHYEIATYGGLVQFALTIGLEDAADLLDKTLMEEEDTDALLTDIAENDINLGAEQEGTTYSWSNQEKESSMAESM